MIASVLVLVSATGAVADEPRGKLRDVTVDPTTSYIGESESYNFTFVTDQRIIGTENAENILIEQPSFDFHNITPDDVVVVYWSEKINQYKEIQPDVTANVENLWIELGLSAPDNIAKDKRIKVYLDEGVNTVENPTVPETYTFDITTYDGYEGPSALDTGSVDVTIEYPDEVTPGSVMVENANTTAWYASINEALTNFPEFGTGDNIIVYDNYSGEPDEGALTWPITVGVPGLTIKAAEGATPTVDATGSGAAAVVDVGVENITIDGLKIVGPEFTDDDSSIIDATDVSSGVLTVNNSTISITPTDAASIRGIDPQCKVIAENNLIDGSGDDSTLGIWMELVGGTPTQDGSVVNNNVFKDIEVGVWSMGIEKVVVENNTFENIRHDGVDVQSVTNKVEDYTVRYNTFEDAGSGVIFWEQSGYEFMGDLIVQNNNFENADAGWSGVDGWAVATSSDYPAFDASSEIAVAISAEKNWWNDPAGPLADGDEDDTRGDNVDIGADITNSSWLDAPYPDGEEVSSIEFDQDVYSSEETVSVTARAGYLYGTDEKTLDVTSSEASDTLSLTLEETDDTGVFENSFSLTDNEDLAEEAGYLLVDNVQDMIKIVDGLDNNWEMTADAFVDMLAPVVDNIVVSEANTDTWLYRGENKIWARGEVEFTANFTENNPENLVFTIGERSIVRTGLAADGSETISEYVSRIADGPVTITATVTDTGGLSDTLEKEIIVDTTPPDVEVVGPEQVGFGPNVENTDIPIEVDADDDVIDDVAGSGVETVVVDVPALENDIPLEYNENSGLWENTIVADVEDLASFEVTATATDRLAQSNDATGTVDVRWDNTAPAIENSWVVYPEGVTEAKVGDTVTVKATVTDDVQVSSVSLDAENVGLGATMEMARTDANLFTVELENIQVAAENVGMRQLTITAKDTANNESAGSLDVSVVGYYSSYEIELERGWNLMSLPILPENTEIQAVLSGLGDAKDNVTSVWGYSTIQEQWSWYAPGMPPTPPEIPRLRTMQDGRAYWIKMEEGATLTIEGREMPAGKGGVTPPSYTLHPGWNLVGFTRVGPATVNEYLGSVEEQVTAMTVFKYTEAGLRTMGGTDTMRPGAGYWVFVSEKATFTAW